MNNMSDRRIKIMEETGTIGMLRIIGIIRIGRIL